MKVRMLVTTWTPRDGYAHTGDVLDVDKHTSDRWFKFRIAEEVSSAKEEVKTSETVEFPTSAALEDETSSVSEETTSPVPEKKKSGKPERKKGRR